MEATMQSSTKLAVAFALIATVTSAAVEYAFTPPTTPQDNTGVSDRVAHISVMRSAPELSAPTSDHSWMRWAPLAGDGQ
jgi:hypothetical protein